MATIKNIKPLSAEKLFDLLKTEFAGYINTKLGSNLAIEYTHVYDVINVSFPEVIEGPALTITVDEEEVDSNRNSHRFGLQYRSVARTPNWFPGSASWIKGASRNFSD